MTLAPGTRLGAYEVLGAIGAGGMGEVYRARDTRLQRDVAIKILPELFAADPERLMRFEREATTLASLNHPHIAQIYGIEVSAGVRALVMELVEGEDLAAQIARGPMALDEAIPIARQVAEALEAAHEAGIIHRDLKPANIKVRLDGTVKVLDFGLAKALDPAGASNPGAQMNSPTFTSPALTQMGLVLGTAAYMAPEQARGKPVDRRADIWAFGVVLYEMLTGRLPFAGEGISEIVAAIIKDEIAWGALPADLPPSVRRLLRHCLEKDPKRRLSSIADARFDLEELQEASPAPSRQHRRAAWPFVLAAGLAGAVLGALGVYVLRQPAASELPVIRAELPLEGLAASRLIGKDDATMALSPDGRLLAYVNEQRSAILLHDLSTGRSRPLVQAGELGAPFFSPDGRSLGYIAGVGGSIRTAVWGSLKMVPISGGAATNLADDITGLKGASWGDDGWIYYSPSPAFGLWRVRADGGAPEKLTEPDAAAGEKTHRLPFVLPGSRAVLFVVGTSRITSFDDARIEMLKLADRTRHPLVEGGTAPRYLPSGHLQYQRGGQLLAMPFDLGRLEVSGVPVAVADGVDYFAPSGSSYDSVSSNGTIVFAPRNPAPLVNTLVAFDDRGQATRLADAPFNPSSGKVSPDGRRIAVDPDGATQQIAILDFVRNTFQRVTFEWDNASPLWVPDGSRLVFRSNIGGGLRRLHWQPADGTGVPEALSTNPRDEIPTSIHGDQLLYEDVGPETRTDIWIMSLDDRTSRPFVQTRFDEGGAQFSPDGRWVAYQSNQSGSWEIYVQAVSGAGGRLQASQDGGVRALWHPDGKSLTFLKGHDVMRVSFDARGAELGLPVRLFSLEPVDLLLDVLPDGRLVVLRRAEMAPTRSLTLLTNWFGHVRDALGANR
jgi:eukaryotic-like serine/threonine-protein kinase